MASGGFDQVAARNFALGIAELHGDRWLLQFDADDYYDPRIVDLLGRLPTTIRGVRCACYHLLDYRSYWQNDHKVVLDGPEPLLNPHIRLWRNDQQRRFSVCAATASAAANKTRHCGVDFSDLLPEQVTDVAEPLHL
ncbi:MAG TPA: hypothetical protein VJ891_01125, partial [Casimicrobiaceae bacterium]|nr:hypothetical protein [Casimicrobiaceae bacterium]